MVAKIIISKNIVKALNYNEQKVGKGQAECIYAGNFIKEIENMNFHEKRERFTDLIGRNSSKTNTLHISLNFDPSEKISNQKMTDIATAYMEKIGFDEQPYLVYRHHDAGHPHLHIVTTNIRTDGSRINTHNIGKNISEPARKEIEKEFRLVKASSKNIREFNRIPAIDAEKVIYGQSETKRAITTVLDTVLRQYKFTSLPELNAVLKSFNVYADRGQENSRTYKHGGLVYRVLDEDGNKAGVPIKASSIHSKPTLTNLQTRFKENEEKRKPHKQSVKERIDQSIHRSLSFPDFIIRLSKRGIDFVPRINEQGMLYGITFVDHKTKSVFNGSDLGKEYSAAVFREKLRELRLKELLDQQARDNASNYPKRIKESDTSNEKNQQHSSSKLHELLNLVFKTESDYSSVPQDLTQKRKKKKRRNLGL